MKRRRRGFGFSPNVHEDNARIGLMRFRQFVSEARRAVINGKCNDASRFLNEAHWWNASVAEHLQSANARDKLWGLCFGRLLAPFGGGLGDAW